MSLIYLGFIDKSVDVLTFTLLNEFKQVEKYDLAIGLKTIVSMKWNFDRYLLFFLTSNISFINIECNLSYFNCDTSENWAHSGYLYYMLCLSISNFVDLSSNGSVEAVEPDNTTGIQTQSAAAVHNTDEDGDSDDTEYDCNLSFNSSSSSLSRYFPYPPLPHH